MTTPATGGFSEATFETFLQACDEPEWLLERRKEAFALFQATPWPTARTRNGDGPTSGP